MKNTYSANAAKIEVSESTKKLFIIKAKVSELYNELQEAIIEAEVIESGDGQKVKNALLDFDEELMRYISNRMTEVTLNTNYKQL